MKILVADDSPILREAVRRLLVPEDHEVVQAADGVEAITLVFEQRPALVLLDLTMPRLNGYVVCRLIKEDPLLATTPVLILTARDSTEDRYWAERSGADGFLTKDALGEGLVAAINATLASQALTQLNRADDIVIPALGETDVLTRVCEMLDRKLFEATVVAELAAVGGQAVRLEQMLESVFEHISRVVSFDAAGIGLVDTSRLYAFARTQVGDTDAEELRDFAGRHLTSLLAPDDKPASLELMWFGEPESDQRVDAVGWGSWYAAGLRSRGAVVGLFVLVARGAGAFPSPVVRTLRTIERPLAGVVASAMEFHAALAREAQTNLSALSGP